MPAFAGMTGGEACGTNLQTALVGNAMLSLEDAKVLLAALEREQVDYVLVGSMGMAVQGLVRATHDVDFFVSPRPENVERLRRALKAAFEDDPNIDSITAEDLGGDYPAIEYTPPHGRYSIDILARLGEAFRHEDLELQEIVWEGIRVRVATPPMLYRMKKDTVRPQDRMDAEWIRERFRIQDKD
jgi:hypothetical protein